MREDLCLIELGGALGAQEIVTGSLSQIGDEYVLGLRRIELSNAHVIGETTASVPVAAAARLQDAVRSSVAQLYGVVAPLAPPPVAPPAAVALAPAPPSLTEPQVEHSSTARFHVLTWTLVVGSAAAAAASIWGFAQYGNFTSLRSQSGTPATTVTFPAAKSASSAAQAGVPVGIAGAVAAVGLGVGAVLVW